MSSALLSDFVRYGPERHLGTQIARCGRFRIMDVAACLMPTNADSEHRACKTRTIELLAEAYPNPAEDDACYHAAADFCETDWQAFLEGVGVCTSKSRRSTIPDSGDESAIVSFAASVPAPTDLVPATNLPIMPYFLVVHMNLTLARNRGHLGSGLTAACACGASRPIYCIINHFGTPCSNRETSASPCLLPSCADMCRSIILRGAYGVRDEGTKRNMIDKHKLHVLMFASSGHVPDGVKDGKFVIETLVVPSSCTACDLQTVKYSTGSERHALTEAGMQSIGPPSPGSRIASASGDPKRTSTYIVRSDQRSDLTLARRKDCAQMRRTSKTCYVVRIGARSISCILLPWWFCSVYMCGSIIHSVLSTVLQHW